jgi:predicted DNA-binding ribbon-helix-helix protein
MGNSISNDNQTVTGASQQGGLVSRNITIQDKRTSVRLEPEMWIALKDIANREQCTIHDICTLIHMRKKPNTSLTASIRVFLMLYFRASSTEEGHRRAGHGNFQSMRMRAKVENVSFSVKKIQHPLYQSKDQSSGEALSATWT